MKIAPGDSRMVPASPLVSVAARSREVEQQEFRAGRRGDLVTALTGAPDADHAGDEEEPPGSPQ